MFHEEMRLDHVIHDQSPLDVQQHLCYMLASQVIHQVDKNDEVTQHVDTNDEVIHELMQ